jgi:hypothetical protein
MNDCLAEYYRCPKQFVRLLTKGPLPAKNGYFRFGEKTVCYGSYCGPQPAESPAGALHDALGDTVIEEGAVHLPFDPSQVARNLRCELYIGDWRAGTLISTLAKVYYLLRPLLSVPVRRLLQRIRLAGWEKLAFPRWPVDVTVDNLVGQLMLLSLKSSGEKRIPLIWFWPDGASSCAIMTHDVETELGRNFCATLMDIDDSFGIKASFQVIPEERYGVSRQLIDSIRKRGFEVAVHDLNHDGHLYRDREDFLKRAEKISSYGKEYGADGFRAAVLYRKQLWYDALKFSYDMSVPNVAHLDPQRGGCCTVMPYFVGDILELPVTTTQDYMLFHLINDYSTDLWKRQIELIMEKHGLISFIVHPDYVVNSKEQSIYKELLGYLDRLRKESGVWITIPGEVNRWWRQRAEMTLVENGEGWKIEGQGKERARVAYASEKEGRLILTLQEAATQEFDSPLRAS